ncbi:hypothetical protein [Castellaniella caeni]|uniref:hypothetical protein n=1 Tax=Castellaniella caeni TaxID=266123 RepID=UPI00082E0D0B|nr:hypothetical protein [Castellaniella caeni]
MASIRKRGEFQWQARVIRKGEKLISKTFTTRQAAEDWATAVEAEVTAEDFVDVRPLSKFKLRDLLDDMPRATPSRKEKAG